MTLGSRLQRIGRLRVAFACVAWLLAASLERWDEALQTFTTLRTRKADYVAMYLMCGQMLEGVGRKDEAREWMDANNHRAMTARVAGQGKPEGVVRQSQRRVSKPRRRT